MTFKKGLDRVTLASEDGDTYYVSEYIMEDSAMYMDIESSSHKVANESEVAEIIADCKLRIKHELVDNNKNKLDIITNKYLNYDLKYGHYNWITGIYIAGVVNNDVKEHEN